MAYDDTDPIEEYLQSMRESVEGGRVSQIEDEAGVGLRTRGEENPEFPGRRISSIGGVGSAISGAAQAGGERFVEELTSPWVEIPGGIQRGREALQNPDLTVLEKLRELGMGGLHAGLSVGRAAFSPITGATRAAVELPVRLAEYEGAERPESVKLALDIAEMLGGAAAGAKGATKVADILKARRAVAGAARDLPPDLPKTSPVLDRLRQMEPEVAPMRLLAARNEPFSPPTERIFDVGPPKSVTGKPSVRYDPAMRDIETGQIKIGAKPTQPTAFGGKSTDVKFGGVAEEGESALEALRRRAKDAMDAAPKIADDIIAGASKGPTIDEVVGPANVSKLSLKDRVRLAATDETKKAAHAISGASDADLAAAPEHIRNAVNAARPENVVDNPSWLPKALRDFGERMKMKLPIFSMTHIAKNDADFAELVSRMKAGTVAEHALRDDLLSQFNQIEKAIGGPKNMEAFVKAVDSGTVPPNLSQTATQFRKLFDYSAMRNSLDPSHPLYEKGYVPHIRNTVMLEKTRMIPVEDWVATDVRRNFPSNFRPSYTKARKIEFPEGLDYSSDTMRGHLTAAARGAVWGTPIHHGVLKDIEPVLRKLSTRSPEMQDFIGNYVNYAIGHPSFRSPEGMQKVGSFIRSGEFARTIVGNVTSPIYNSFQRILPITEVSWASSAKAARDELRWLRRNPELRALVKEAEIPLESLGPGKLDTEAFMGGRVRAALTKVQDVGGIPFGLAERQNRVFSFFAGYHEAVRKGADKAQAIKAGRDMIDKTQFTPGPTDRPPWMRGEVLGTVGQFKYFQTKLGEYVWNNFSDMFKKSATSEQRLSAANKFVKFWGTSYALGGPQVMPILGDWLEKHDPIQWKGALPYMGVAVKNQLGLGTVLPENMSSLWYQIPGPALTHAKDLLTALGYDPENPTKIQDVASRTRAATRSFPIAGIGLSRLRQGLLTSPQGELREPQTLAEAIPPVLGGTPIPSSRPLLERGVSRIGKAIGINDPEQEKQFTLMDEFNRATAIKNKALADAAQALSIHDRSGADKILREAEKELGLPYGRLKVSPQSVKAQKGAAQMTPLERRRKAGGKALRNYGEEDTLP
jgi:hypothetical protein